MVEKRAVLVCRKYYVLDSVEVRASGRNEFDEETYVGPREVEDNVVELQELRKLHVEKTRIEEIPRSVGKVRSLANVTLVENPVLTSVDESLAELPNLKVVLFKNCPLKKLPEFGWNQRNSLSHLSAVKCGIKEIPESFGELHSLLNLIMPRNKITKIPRSMGGAKRLVHIDLEGNQIIDAQILHQCTSLKTV